MSAQQMIEHLSAVTQIANGNWNVDVFVSDEKAKRRQPFLNTDNELQIGFKASFVSEDPVPLKFGSISKAVDDLLYQISYFFEVFNTDSNRVIVHPFFGALNFEQWKKFQIKHFTHHFKQFGLI